MIHLATYVGKIATTNYEHAEQGSGYVMEYGIEHPAEAKALTDYTFVMLIEYQKPRVEKVVRKVIKTREDLNREVNTLLDHSGPAQRHEGSVLRREDKPCSSQKI